LSTIVSTVVHTSVLRKGIRCMAMRDGTSNGPRRSGDHRSTLPTHRDGDRFPVSPDYRHTPPDPGVDDLRRLHDRLGLEQAGLARRAATGPTTPHSWTRCYKARPLRRRSHDRSRHRRCRGRRAARGRGATAASTSSATKPVPPTWNASTAPGRSSTAPRPSVAIPPCATESSSTTRNGSISTASPRPPRRPRR